ncbi:MAG: crossover junction endodeoxyribonuclease RuvC [Acidobacteria bacterium]|nr:crossover junction endodeoxyribonuclease RuvC [Acidobacteriota bacterium]MBI3280155.1 crossover junction endodeoxyribonuclease RuvC [Acidobacteriota bacterium]
MRVLGIDCGAERTGYGVIASDGLAHSLVASGVIRTRPADPFAQRLLQIARGLREVIIRYEPTAGAVEEVFHAANVQSALKLAHVRGIALLALAEAGIAVGEYSALVIKQTVVGYGRAEKSQVQLMVKSLLQLDYDVQSPDAADAIAVAICHATHARAAARLGAAR